MKLSSLKEDVRSNSKYYQVTSYQWSPSAFSEVYGPNFNGSTTASISTLTVWSVPDLEIHFAKQLKSGFHCFLYKLGFFYISVPAQMLTCRLIKAWICFVLYSIRYKIRTREKKQGWKQWEKADSERRGVERKQLLHTVWMRETLVLWR